MTDADELEAETDRLMQRAMPKAYAAMIANRQRRDGEVTIDSADGRGTMTVVVSAAPTDSQIEALLGSLLVQSYVAASTSFKLAASHTKPGQPLALRDAFVHQGARLSRACVELSEALANRRDRGRRFVKVEHVHVHDGGQAIVGAVASRAVGK
jgi:hypothetical protein